MQILTNNKKANIMLLSAVGLIVIGMLSSFVNRMFIAPPVDPNIDSSITKNTHEEVIQVNVLNACGKKGLAAKAKEFLRSRGFDVVEIGNFEQPMPKSVIIDRLGDINSAKKVAYALGIQDTLIQKQVDSTLYLRSTIVIGDDFAILKPFK